MLDKQSEQSEWAPTDVEVAKTFERLDINAASVEKELQGSINRVFAYTDEAGRRRVLRIRPKWLTERRICFEHSLAYHLAEQGVPLLLPLILPNGSTWSKIGNCYIEVYPFVMGREGRAVAQDAYLAGKVLAQFHQKSLSLDQSLYEAPRVKNQLEASKLLSRLEELSIPATREKTLASLLPHAQPTLDCAHLRIRELQSREDEKHLPVTVRHGDPHIWNFIFSEEEPSRVLALLDLDMAAEGSRIFDVSYALYFLIHSTASGNAYLPSPNNAWQTPCWQFMRGYAASTDMMIQTTEVAVSFLQMHCIAAHFYYWDIVWAVEQNTLATACQRYQSIAVWLDEHEAELSEILVAKE